MNTYDEQQEQQQQQRQQLQQQTAATELLYQQELLKEEQALFGEYDRAIATAALTADYYDYYNNDNALSADLDNLDEDVVMDNYYDKEQDQEEDNDIENQSVYDYQNDSLLHLIVGVQSYLSDVSSAGIDRHDSPLLDLQYKMYTYLKRRACDMGVDIDNLWTKKKGKKRT